MEINTSVSQNTPLVKSQGNNVQKPAPQSQAALRIEPDKQSTSANKSQRFDVDALALVTQEQQSLATELSSGLQSTNNSSGNTNASGSTNTSESNNAKGRYDQPSQQNKSAVAAYQSIGNQAKRDDIQQVFGVDLFA